MQINITDNQNFGAIKYGPGVKGALFSRLNSYPKYKTFKAMELEQEINPVDIYIKSDNKGTLSAVVGKDLSNPIFEKKESRLSSLLNLSPLKFIRKLCLVANSQAK